MFVDIVENGTDVKTAVQNLDTDLNSQ